MVGTVSRAKAGYYNKRSKKIKEGFNGTQAQVLEKGDMVSRKMQSKSGRQNQARHGRDKARETKLAQ